MKRLQFNIINRIDRNIGSIGVATFSAALFLFYGTLISFLWDWIDYLFFTRSDGDLEHEVLIIFALIGLCAAFLIILIAFVNLAIVLSRKSLLPHLLDSVINKATFLVGIPSLLILSYFQQFLYEFETNNLIETLELSLITCLFIYFASLFNSFTAIARKQLDKVKNVALNALSILLALVDIALILTIVAFFFDDFNYTLTYAVIAFLITFIIIMLIENYYNFITKKLAINLDEAYIAHPTKIHAFVLTSKVNKPTIRAISFAKTLHPDVEILGIGTNSNNYCDRLKQAWVRSNLPIPLRVYSSSHNNVPRSAYDFIKSITLNSKRELIVVYIPHFSPKNFLEGIMHNQTSNKIEKELKKLPNLVISSIPWQRF